MPASEGSHSWKHVFLLPSLYIMPGLFIVMALCIMLGQLMQSFSSNQSINQSIIQAVKIIYHGCKGDHFEWFKWL
jgi:hypothetical protein